MGVLSPNKLIETFTEPKLTVSDMKKVAVIESGINAIIIGEYGDKYNNISNFIPDGFKTTIYTYRLFFMNDEYDSEVLVKAYLLNQYRKNGWEIKIGDNWRWDIKFNIVELRNNTIDEILLED